MPDAVVSKSKVATESRQTSPYHPSAPSQESIMKSANTLQGR